MMNCRLIHGMARSCIFRGCGRERASNPIPGFARGPALPSVTGDSPAEGSGRTPAVVLGGDARDVAVGTLGRSKQRDGDAVG
jgi:hypothetical protein